jgi:phenylpyruvate tautomerase PptA (4-oxalocrotonate tautomerase family)
MMITKILTTHEESTQVLIEQTKTCISASWAVAWATPNRVFNAAMARMDAFKHLIVGTHGSHTHPKCLRDLAKHPGKTYIRRSGGGLFHPKLYMFEHADKVTVVIGSHNMTRGAFEANDELSLLTEFEKTDKSVKNLYDWITDAAKPALCVVYSEPWITEYERVYKLARENRMELDELRKDTSSQVETNMRESLPINLSWEAWYTGVSSESSLTHGLQKRLKMLDRAGELFDEYGSYAAMPPNDRLRISGLASKEMCDEDEIDWGYFGAMRVAAAFNSKFKTLVIDKPDAISAALDIIPLHGPVNEAHWNEYWAGILGVNSNEGGLGHGLATRLATMRRPGVFVSLNGGSAEKLSELLGVPVGKLNGPNYWKRVIQEVRQTDWYLSHEPKDDPTQAKAWRSRAALLDALVYKA